MAEHPSFTLAGLRESTVASSCEIQSTDVLKVSVGGTAGYLRTRSTPSLVAGIGLGASYAYAGKNDLCLLPGSYVKLDTSRSKDR